MSNEKSPGQTSFERPSWSKIHEAREIAAYWEDYIYSNLLDWEEAIEGREPRKTRCGEIYELPRLAERPNESLAIADMRNLTKLSADHEIPAAEPHFHIKEIEIYFPLAGRGRIVKDGVEELVKGPVENKRGEYEGDIMITHPYSVHYAIPHPQEGLVMAVVNTPPFSQANYINEDFEHYPSVVFNTERFEELVNPGQNPQIITDYPGQTASGRLG